MDKENGLLKFITCGSVDDGKSTLIGHILYDAKLLHTDQEKALILDSQIGSRGGKIDYSLLLDGLMAEREQGITIDVAYRYFTTNSRSFIVADTPGHEEYTRNMAVGASFADLAIILTDATQGVLQQTCRHARICAIMGIKNFVFAVNKMDLIDYSREHFNSIELDIITLCETLGLERTVIIPVSATEGDNVTKHSANMPWYKGPALLEHLETVDISRVAAERGFYMPVQRVCRPNHSFRGFQGQIEAGKISIGESITALPSGETAVIKSVYIGDRQAETAVIGQPVTVQLDREVDVSRGCVLSRDADLKTEKVFTATLLWMDNRVLVTGMDYWVKLGTKLLPSVVKGIKHKIDINSGALVSVDSLTKNEIALCEIELAEPIVLDEFKRHKTMGELILIDRISNTTAACGVVESVGERNKTILKDKENELTVQLFDNFYYNPDIHTITRHSSPPKVYNAGDILPLISEGYNYPPDFDIPAGSDYANIRGGGIFTGFGKRDPKLPLIGTNGIEPGPTPSRAFDKYRKVLILENDYTI